MNGVVIAALLLVVPGCYRGQTLDKTGTTGCRSESNVEKTLKKQEPADAGSCLAERAGFEPATKCPCKSHISKPPAQNPAHSPLATLTWHRSSPPGRT